jgi:long-chain acyl-CoA synthetase
MPTTVTSRTRSSTTIFSAFRQVAHEHPDQVAFKANGGQGRHYTYREVGIIAAQLSAGLCRPEFDHVERIGILSENRPEWGIAYLAILAAGRTVVPIDAGLKGDEVSFIIHDAGLGIVFTSGRFESFLKERHSAEVKIFSFEDNSSHSWSVLAEGEQTEAKSRVNKTAVLIYTSGTTGTPKAVELTHQNLLANLEGIASALKFDHNDIFLSVLPMHNTFEATCGFLTPLISGSTIVYARSLKSKEIFEDIAANNVTLMCGVPLLFEKMYHSMQRKITSTPVTKRLLFHTFYFLSAIAWNLGFKLGKYLFSSMRNKAGLAGGRMFVSGGAAMPPKIARFFNLIGFDFLQGYGMTECSPVISVNRPDDVKFGSVGPPLENVEVRIHNPDSHGIGEIIVRGNNVTPGYRGNPEKTSELIINGWLHTGDLGCIKNGHLWITGRKKNVIVSAAGKNIYPEELEEKLLESNYILEAVVFGRRKQNKHGEEVCALIVPDVKQIETELGVTFENPDSDRIRNIISPVVKNVNDRVADYKRIAGFDVQLAELEKTSTRKVKRFLYR